MDLQTRKLTFIQEFLRVENEGIISGLESMLKERKSELFEENLKPMSLDKYNFEIDKAMDDSENERIIKATDLKSKYV